jgi:sec-independent protein translocase protein TatA
MVLLGMIGGQEIILILIVVLVLFGGKKIPELMKGLGKGVKEYKKAVNGAEEDANGGDAKPQETTENNATNETTTGK